MNVSGKCIYAFISGSSRGFGLALSKAFLHSVMQQKPSRVLLHIHGRDADRLQSVRDSLLADYSDLQSCLTILSYTDDLKHVNQTLQSPLDVVKQMDIIPDYAFLFNNAGILQPTPLTNFSVPSFTEIINVNLTAMAHLCSIFVSYFHLPTKLYIVHTSSLAAIKPVADWAGYCCSKAGADMLHQVVANDHKNVRVLNYGPGPMDTAMTRKIGKERDANAETAEIWETMRQKGTLVDKDVSAGKLMKVVWEDAFESGQHLDFFEC